MSYTHSDPDSLKSSPWYKAELTSISPLAREIIEAAGIPPDQVLEHVKNVRDQAWNVYPYPCMGMFTFVMMLMSKQPLYPTILQRLLQNDETLLDLGCGFGQELRPLIHAGVPAKNLYGLDVVDGFVNLGFDLFKDKDVLGSQFVIADLLKGVPPQLEGKFNIIFAASFFHLFDWDEQLITSKRAVAMLKPEVGSLIWGFQIGGETEGSDKAKDLPSGSMFHHTPESFERMWKIVGEETGTRWKVDCTSSIAPEIADLRKTKPILRFLRYSIERLAD